MATRAAIGRFGISLGCVAVFVLGALAMHVRHHHRVADLTAALEAQAMAVERARLRFDDARERQRGCRVTAAAAKQWRGRLLPDATALGRHIAAAASRHEVHIVELRPADAHGVAPALRTRWRGPYDAVLRALDSLAHDGAVVGLQTLQLRRAADGFDGDAVEFEGVFVAGTLPGSEGSG